VPIPSARVGPVSIQKRASQVANAVWIQGGERQFPNVYPSDMETPTAKAITEGNRVSDSGFEHNPILSIWSLYGGASRKTGGLSEGATIGSHSVETDNVGEGATQAIIGIVTPAHDYQFGGQVRQIHSADTNEG